MYKGYFLILAMILTLTSCKGYENLNIDFCDQTIQEYKVTRIRKTNVGYIIYAKKGSLKYQIISNINERKNKNCDKIRRGEVYKFDLEVVHPSPGMVPNLAIVLVYGRIKLPLRKKYHYKIYKANNLDGLCIIN